MKVNKYTYDEKLMAEYYIRLGYEYIAKDKDGSVHVFISEIEKVDSHWELKESPLNYKYSNYIDLFRTKVPEGHFKLPNISWENDTPTSLTDILAHKEIDVLDDDWFYCKDHKTLKKIEQAIEKAKSKKAELKEYKDGSFYEVCPICGNQIRVAGHMTAKYCCECGQKIDWEE